MLLDALLLVSSKGSDCPVTWFAFCHGCPVTGLKGLLFFFFMHCWWPFWKHQQNRWLFQFTDLC